MLAAFSERLFHAILFSEVPFADELDLDARVRCQLLRVFANAVPERLGEPGVIEIRMFLSNRNEVIPPAKQIFGKVPKISIRSQQPSTPAIWSPCRSVNSSMAISAS